MSIKSRRGRPPKGDGKLANKTKQQNYRRRKKQKESESRHLANVAAVIERLRGSQTATYNPLRRLQMNMLLLSAIEIENYLSELARHHDTKGRLHGESSGGYDLNKIAQIVAAIQRDSNGRRVRPRGSGPV
jgi:hypothetical protein